MHAPKQDYIPAIIEMLEEDLDKINDKFPDYTWKEASHSWDEYVWEGVTSEVVKQWTVSHCEDAEYDLEICLLKNCNVVIHVRTYEEMNVLLQPAMYESFRDSIDTCLCQLTEWYPYDFKNIIEDED